MTSQLGRLVGVHGSGKNAIKVQGDTEDYVAELVEELTRRIPRHLFPPSPKLLNLLHYLNDAQKFNKFCEAIFQLHEQTWRNGVRRQYEVKHKEA